MNMTNVVLHLNGMYLVFKDERDGLVSVWRRYAPFPQLPDHVADAWQGQLTEAALAEAILAAACPLPPVPVTPLAGFGLLVDKTLQLRDAMMAFPGLTPGEIQVICALMDSAVDTLVKAQYRESDINTDS